MANTTKTKKKSKTTEKPVKPVLAEAKIDLDKTTPGAAKIDDYAMIKVQSNVFGELFFVDPVTKEEISWPSCGSIQVLPMSTLRHMKTGAIGFFTKQLVIITGFADENADKFETADIYKSLFITEYYRNIIDPADYESVCAWSVDDIRKKVPMLSASSKGRLVVALNTYIEKGMLDSLKAIRAFEEALGCELTRPE